MVGTTMGVVPVEVDVAFDKADGTGDACANRVRECDDPSVRRDGWEDVSTAATDTGDAIKADDRAASSAEGMATCACPCDVSRALGFTRTELDESIAGSDTLSSS
jgi:hypothetical protein